MAKLNKININGTEYDVSAAAGNVVFTDNKTAEQLRVSSAAFTEQATGVKLEIKDKDGNVLASDTMDKATKTLAGAVVVDDTLSATSTNPVENKAIQAGLDTKITTVKVNGTAVTMDANKAVDIPDTTYAFESKDDKIVVTPKVNGANQTAVDLELKITDNITGSGTKDKLAVFTASGVIGDKDIDTTITKDTATGKVTSTNIPTAKAVADYLADTLGDIAGAMTYVRGVTTTNPLPTTGYTVGLTFVVAEEGTYAGKSLKVGDMLIANKDYKAGTASNNDWTAVSPTPKVEDKKATIGTTDTVIAVVDGKDITVKNEFDDELDDTSDNAVQNKVVKEELDKKAEMVELVTATGTAKNTLANIVKLVNPQFTYQGQDVIAQKISATECIWYRVDDKKLYTYKQTASGITSSYKELAFMEDADLLDSNGEFYTALLDVMHGTSGGIYFAEAGNTDDFLAHIYAKTSSGKETLHFQDGSGNDVTLRGVDTPTRPEDAVNKAYADRHEIYNGGTTSPYLSKFTNAQIFANKDVRYMFKGYDLTYKSTPTATKAEFFYLVGNEEHTLVVENNQITDTVEKLAQLNEIDVLKTGQEQKLVVKFVDSSASPIVWDIGTYYDLADKKVKTYVNGSSDPMVLAPTLKLSETPSPNVIYLDDITKKIYQWNPTTNEMADIPTGGDTLVQVTYADLVTLRNNEQLSPGTKYRITDFVTTTNGSFLSAGFPFDVVVTALAPNKLAEDATAMVHDGDTHFANSMIGRWELKYDLNNDTSKYTWALPTGKGVIYYMKDEFLNESYYDFKNIMYDGISFTFGADSDESITGACMANVIKPWNTGIGKYALNHVIMSPGCINNNIDFNCLDLSFGAGCSSNKIGAECGNIMLGDACLSNVLGNSCIDIELGSNCNLITIGNNVNTVFINDDSNLVRIGDFNSDISMNGQSMQVSIGNNNNTIDIRDSAADVTIGDFCQQLVLTELAQAKIGNSVYDLTTVANNNIEIGDSCSSVVLYEGANRIKLGKECGAISIAENSNNITFGNNCSDIITSNTWENVVFGNNCKSVKFIEQGRSAPPYDAGSLTNIHVADGTRNVSFYLAVDAYSRDILNLNIHKGFNESANVNYTIDCRRMTHTYEQYEVALDSNKTLHVWNDADLPVLLDYCDFRPFSPSTLYYTGSVVTYNGRLYQFTDEHSPGPWNTSQVSSISVRERIEHLYEVEKVLTAGLAALALRVDDLEDYIP